MKFPFLTRYRSLVEIMTDRELSALGDAYVNFIFSLALSRRLDRPVGMKAQSTVLSRALRKADLRKLLPHRVDRHKQADAAEAIIVYAWIRGIVTIEECVAILEQETEPDEAFAILLKTILKKVKFT
ncbi:MAG: ribonuclease III family protein [Candidatus Bathyarchaeia archaeon]